MAGDRWQRLQELFEAASRLVPGERASYLDRCCERDTALRSEIEALLRADEASSGLFLAPVAGVAASLSAEPPDADSTPSDTASALMDGGPSLVGRRIGAYQLTGELGRGGMGTVYRAVRADDAYRKEVAIKLIRQGADNPELLRRFLAERQILATLDHPNIARLLDGGTTDDGVPYVVMERVRARRSTATATCAPSPSRRG